MTRFFVTVLLLILSQRAGAQIPEARIIKDLKSDWKVFSNNQYRAYDPSVKSGAIYFLVDAGLYKGASLRIESQQQFSIFINGKLVIPTRKGSLFFDLDSLSRQYAKQLDIGIVRLPFPIDISTQIVLRNVAFSENENLLKRKEQYFLNFSILAVLVLLVFLVSLLRTNPKLTFDYLNFVKLFSVQEREENMMATRITSSANLLFYAFVGLFTAFILLVIFHFGHTGLGIARSFQVHSVQEGFSKWFVLAGLIFLILFGKLIVISLFAYLYKATEVTVLQFFNFIRLFFFTFGIISLLAVVFFIGKVQDPAWYYNLFYVATAVFIFWQIIIFLKLMSRVPFRIFHLFFYLCASELIPLVILIKVVFY